MATVFLSPLNADAAVGTAGTVDDPTTTAISDVSTTLCYGAPIENIAPIFKFFTATPTATDTDASVQTFQALNFIGDSSSSSSSSSTSGLYNTDNNGAETHTEGEINDDAGAAQTDFLEQLSLVVFGTTEASDLFTNEAAITAAYGTAVEAACTTVNANFNADSTATVLGSISSSSDNNLRAAKVLFLYLLFNYRSRFALKYNAVTGSGTIADETGCAVTGGASQTGSPTVDVTVTDTTIDNIVINTTGGGFVKGDGITITGAGDAFTITITINAVQAAILNGTLDDSTVPTEFPLEVNDKFLLKLGIQSKSDQTLADGTTLADQVVRNAKLIIKLL